jgi:hypothetical protein
VSLKSRKLPQHSEKASAQGPCCAAVPHFWGASPPQLPRALTPSEKKALQKNQCHYYGKRMARKPNPVKSVQITVSTTPLVHGYLSALVDTGLYGKNAAEAAERLIAKGVEVALAGGIIPRRETRG